MKQTKLGNGKIFLMDWAAADRRAALRALHSGPPPRGKPPAHSSGWGTDVAGGDKRSVKAMLMGKGDLRGTWWNLFSRVRRATLEHAMHAFHRMHHGVTLARVSYSMSVRQAVADIEHRGVPLALRDCGGIEIGRH